MTVFCRHKCAPEQCWQCLAKALENMTDGRDTLGERVDSLEDRLSEALRRAEAAEKRAERMQLERDAAITHVGVQCAALIARAEKAEKERDEAKNALKQTEGYARTLEAEMDEWLRKQEADLDDGVDE